ncbi:hypothetical protein BU17DRAFT_96499 [Hysterangium stoloniferum]|nr:hypothetical protein BU17DRAFT_96499 [Hysterangium stoloniferum]
MDTLIISESVTAFTVPLAELQAKHLNKRLVVGIAIVVNLSKKWNERKLLLIKRSSTEDEYPLMYEIPGGGAEIEDVNILVTVLRETKEETGLDVTGILRTFDGFEYSTRKGQAIQFNFLVENYSQSPSALTPTDPRPVPSLPPSHDPLHDPDPNTAPALNAATHPHFKFKPNASEL